MHKKAAPNSRFSFPFLEKNVYSLAGSVPSSSHLTSCTPTKSNLDSSLKTVGREVALNKLLTFHNPNLTLNEFNNGYQPRNNLVKDENDDLLADSHNILNRWKNYFSLLLNVNNVNVIRQLQLHRVEPLVRVPSHLEVEISITKLKKYNSSVSDQIPAELIQARDKMLLSVIYKLINSVWTMEELLNQWKESIIVPIHKKGGKTDCSN
jgi:hypothetical protein